MSKSFFYIILFTTLCSGAAGQGVFEFDALTKSAYEAALSLRFDQANSLCSQLHKEQPNNLAVHLVEDYIDFFTFFIDEDYDVFQSRLINKQNRLTAIREGDITSPYYLYLQAEIHLHWALARVKFEEYFNSFIDVKNAFKLLTKNEELFPNFIPNKKSLGMLHALIGTVPESYQWGIKLIGGGMQGSISQGQAEIEEVIEYSKTNDFLFQEETGVMYALLLLHLRNKNKEAWQKIYELDLDATSNPLAAFTLANVAMRTGQNDLAISILQKRPKGPEFKKFPYLDYMLGLAKLHRLDKDARFYLRKYLSEFKGLNYIKEAYQKIGWSYLIENNEAEYRVSMQSCLEHGAAIIGGDKMAMRAAEQKNIPHPLLIKVRILYDGGYYQKALEALLKAKPNFAKQIFQIEYDYRLGRIQQQLGNRKLAIASYQKTIDAGADLPEYYACNAALQIGIIYEQLNDCGQAKEWFERCIAIKPKEYKASLHQKAKAGVDRCRL